MAKIFFGKIGRHAPFRGGGDLVRMDWVRKEVEAKIPIFPQDPSLEGLPNPRRTGQGCRGIEFYTDKILAAHYHTIHVFDHQLRHQMDIKHNLLSDIHEISGNGDGPLYVSSTNIDAVLEFDLENGTIKNEYWPREMLEFQKALKITSLDLEKDDDHRVRFLGGNPSHDPSHLHLNATVCWRDEVYALFNAFGVVANLSRRKIVLQDSSLKGAHNLIITDEGIAIINDTRGGAVRFYDIESPKLVKLIRLTDFAWVNSLKRSAQLRALFNYPRKAVRKLFHTFVSIAHPLFLRGLDIAGDLIFVGMSPATIVCINWRKGEFIDGFRYSKNIRHCVHGLKVLKE